MTRPVIVSAVSTVILSAALIAAVFAISSTSTDAADTGDSTGPAGPSAPVADMKTLSVTVAYLDVTSETGSLDDAITAVEAGQVFKVRVDFSFHNNGPDQSQAEFTVQLLTPPEGCSFVDPANGTVVFESTVSGEPFIIPVSTGFNAAAILKVRCDTPGPKSWEALAIVAPVEPGVDPEDANDQRCGTSPEPILITGDGSSTPLPTTVEDTPTPTPTPTPTATPTPTGGGGPGEGCPPGGPGIPPTPSPTPTFTPTDTPFPTPFQDPFFSVRANGPSGLDPADILRAPGSIPIIECLEMGLDCDGVDGEGAPIQDDIDALTFANERQAGQIVFFSTDSQSVGIEGSGTHSQSNANQQCHEEGNEYYEFPIGVGGDNRVFFPATALGLLETTCPDTPDDDDDMDALAWGNSVQAEDTLIYISLAPNSPTLTELGASPADILVTEVDGEPAIYRTAASLGLQAGDDIDGVCLFREDGEDRFLLSLSRGSPTLALIGATPDDVLFPGGPGFLPNIFKDNTQFGLLGTDNIDAMKCQEPEPPRGPQGDFDCNGVIDSTDALYLLLFIGGGAIDIPDCPQVGTGPADALEGDLNCDGEINAADLILVMKAAAGLPVFLTVGCPPIGGR